jgi:hypothetical protein
VLGSGNGSVTFDSDQVAEKVSASKKCEAMLDSMVKDLAKGGH